MSTKVKGTVKWFSNKKGFGFITPATGSSISDDVFVHQSVITSDGYRTLCEGWAVEFDIGRDDDGKIKAENVTAPGGGPCTGPRPIRTRHSNSTNNPTATIASSSEVLVRPQAEPSSKITEARGGVGAEGRGNAPRTRFGGGRDRVFWHDSLSESVKTSLKTKSIRTSTGTIDLAVGMARIKLGTRGYCSMARADSILAEGTFTCEIDGIVSFQWTRAIQHSDSWKPLSDKSGLLTTFSLLDDAVGPVRPDETPVTLMGNTVTDPATALEDNGFQMRHIVLTAKRR